MRKPNTTVVRWFCAFAILAATGPEFQLPAQTPAPAPTDSPEQAAAKLKGKWVRAFEDARRGFIRTNDRESLEFVTKLLASLDQPDSLSPAAIATKAASLRAQVRDLVGRGALDSAGTLNWAEWRVLDTPDGGNAGPANPNHKTGGTPNPNGLVLYFSCDAPATDGIIHDESGAGNDGEVHGATWVPAGRIGGAYHFSITNLDDRIQVPNSDLLNPDQITLAAWFKTDVDDRFFTRIIDKDYRRGYDFNLSGDIDGRSPRGRIGFEDNDMWVGNDRPLVDGHWHHVTGTYDGQINRIYVDGVQVGQRKATKPGPLAKNNWDLCVGNSVADHGTGEFLAYDGLIDEVRIYNRALSAAEVKALADATKAGVDAATPPPETKPDATARLKQVKALLDQGLIDKEDYDRKVKEIMDSL